MRTAVDRGGGKEVQLKGTAEDSLFRILAGLFFTTQFIFSLSTAGFNETPEKDLSISDFKVCLPINFHYRQLIKMMYSYQRLYPTQTLLVFSFRYNLENN
jgi:hypothetical protein